MSTAILCSVIICGLLGDGRIGDKVLVAALILSSCITAYIQGLRDGNNLSK